MNDLTAAAHAYRARGWRVIQLHSVGPDGETCSCNRGRACTSKGKHPRDNAWQKTEPYSAADIEALWEERPKANVGIATGAPSGFWVLDIDPDSGGMDTMNALVAEHGWGIEPTMVVRTGSGGWHYYFRMPDFDVTNSQGRVGRGIDVRGTGGQVVAPPSVTDKGTYAGGPSEGRMLRHAPEWLLDLVRKPEVESTTVTAEELPKPEEISEAEWDRLNAYAARAIDGEVRRLRDMHPNVWEANGAKPWNATTFEVACNLLEIANSTWNCYSTTDAYDTLHSNAPRDEGFTDDEVNKIWGSAVQKVGQNARAMPASKPRAQEYDLFSSPDVRGGGDDDQEVDLFDSPDVRERGRLYFKGPKEKLDAVELAAGILDMGPIGWGRDEAFWSYQDGVWHSDRKVVKHRAVRLLGPDYRPGHAQTAADVVQVLATPLPGDPVSQWMNFRNGMLDWQTGELADHSPDYLSTIQFPIDYNPTADCPNFDRFLGSILHPDYVRLAWQMIGYLMYSGNPQQVAFLFYGGGQNGKGTLIRVIETILGRANIAHESLDQLNKSTFSTVNLYGKIANVAGDIDATYQESTANFKKITGEDVLGAERKFGDRFEFENWAVPLFSANEIPGSADVTEGYLRRWVVLHFRRHIEESEKVPGLSDLLATEVEGIAAKAIPALREVMRARAFDLSGEAAKGNEEFAETIDQIRQWVKHGGPRPAPDHAQPLEEIYFEYTVWANKSNQKPLRMSSFSRRLAGIGFPVEDVAGVTYHKGLRVTAADRLGQTNSFF